MPNGKPHDHPVTDTVFHGLHPFPPDVESLVLQVHARNPGVFNDLKWAPLEWEKGSHLAEATRLGSDRKIQWPRQIKVGCRETRRSFVLGVRSKEKWREKQ
jgi:hypothetical protein